MSPLFGETYRRAKVANTKEEFLRSKEATSAAVAWGTSFVGGAMQSYGIGALINATGTVSYRGAAYLGALVFLATSAPGVSISLSSFLHPCPPLYPLNPSFLLQETKQWLTPEGQSLAELFIEKRPLETVGLTVLAKLLETIGLSCVLTWWGTRTNPFD